MENFSALGGFFFFFLTPVCLYIVYASCASVHVCVSLRMLSKVIRAGNISMNFIKF